VLRLLYCQSCGELFLQGFVAPVVEVGSKFADQDRFLVAELGELDAIPDQAKVEDNALNSILYWPRAVDEGSVPTDWTRDGHTFSFKPARFDPGTGRLEQKKPPKSSGWMFEVRASPQKDLREGIPGLPILCPQCGADCEIFKSGPQALPITSRSRTRSPIRRMGTGYEKVAQVLVDAMVRELRSGGLSESQRRLVLFSDSRQDAAKLSAGLEKRHYQDLVRQLVVSRLDEEDTSDVELVRRWFAGDNNPETKAARNRLRVEDRELYDALDDEAQGEDGAAEEVARILAARAAGVSVLELRQAVELSLAALGINPAGPDPSVSSLYSKGEGRVEWYELYDLTASPPARKTKLLSTIEERLRSKIDEAALQEVFGNVFAGTGRDLESLGLAIPSVRIDPDVSPPAEMEVEQFREVVRSSGRLLGDDRRFQGRKGGVKDAPASVRRYWGAVAAAAASTPAAAGPGPAPARSGGRLGVRRLQAPASRCCRRDLHRLPQPVARGCERRG
jgi:hypothetical protein